MSAIVPGAVTSHTHVMSCADTGRRTFFAQLGVNNLMTVEHLLPPEDSNAKLYYLGSPGVARGLDASGGWQVLLKAARDQGMKTCLELCPVPADVLRAHVPPCLPLCDYFVVNDYEAGSITGIDVTNGKRLDWTAAEAACRKLLDMGVAELAGVHHPDGAVAVTRNGEVAQAPVGQRRRSRKLPARSAPAMPSMPACCSASTRTGRWTNASTSATPPPPPRCTRPPPAPPFVRGRSVWPMQRAVASGRCRRSETSAPGRLRVSRRSIETRCSHHARVTRL